MARVTPTIAAASTSAPAIIHGKGLRLRSCGGGM
jgi:hypothetical protein